MSYRRPHSPPGRNRRGHSSMQQMDPLRASSGSLNGGNGGVGGDSRMELGMDRMMPGGFPEGAGRGGGDAFHHPADPVDYHYGHPNILPPPPHRAGPPPAAPPPPHSGQQTPYSTHPHSPTSSSDNLEPYPNHPPPPHHHHHLAYAPAPPSAQQQQQLHLHQPPPPSPSPRLSHHPSDMRGGDGALGRRNTTSGVKPAIHQHYGVIEQPDYRDFHSHRPVIHAHPSSSQGRDFSPPHSSAPFMVIPNSGGAVHRSTTYMPDSSGYSDGSYEEHDIQSRGQMGYIIPAGGGSQGRPRSHEYSLGQAPSERRSRMGDSANHLDGPPRRRGRRERSRSRPGRAMSDEYEYDDPTTQKRIANGPTPTMSGALVRSRSRSESRGPSSSGGALVRRRSSDEERALVPVSTASTGAPSNGTIRLEYGGQAIDIAYTGSNGKPLVGNITINTTARTVSIPDQPTPPQQQQIQQQPHNQPQQQPQPLALPPNVHPVMLPPPPPPPSGYIQQALPAPPSRHGPRSERDSDDTDYSPPPTQGRDGNDHQELYQSLKNLQLEAPPAPAPAPPAPPSHRPIIHDDSHGRRRREERELAPAPSGPQRNPGRARSRSRPAPRSRSRGPSEPPEDPLWTKISRDIVSKRAVLVRGYEHEEVPNSIIIYRVLNEEEIDDLVELSDKIRTGKVEVVRRESGTSRSSGRPRRRKSSSSRQRSSSRRRPMSIHGYPGAGGSGGPLGPGPSKERPPPGKPAIVSHHSTPPPPRALPEAPPAPFDDMPESARAPAPPVTVTQTKGGLRENPEIPGTYVGYSRKPPRGQGPVYRTRR